MRLGRTSGRVSTMINEGVDSLFSQFTLYLRTGRISASLLVALYL